MTEIDKIMLSQSEERLALAISSVAYIIESLLNDPLPFPTHVLSEIERLSEYHSIVLKSKGVDYFTISVEEAKRSFSENKILINSEPNIHKNLIDLIERYSKNPDKLDIESIKLRVFDNYFLNFREYWEGQISQLKRISAILNRRKYLIEKCSEWKDFLNKQNIHKYDSILDDYSSFNNSELSLY